MGEHEQTVRFELEEGVATVTLDRPERLNAWTPQLGDDLRAALRRCEQPDVRCVVVTGAGRAFSAGADLKQGFPREGAVEGGRLMPSKVLRQHYHPVLVGVRELPKPVIAAVNGVAAGIGCSLALCCDLVWAAESATFGLAFVRIGLMPDGGSTALVPAAVGRPLAYELAFLGEQVSAPRAQEIGLINRAVPDSGFDDAVQELASELAAGPTRAMGLAKRALGRSTLAEFEAQLEFEAELQDEAMNGEDFREGVAAFLEKRAPDFSGT